MKQPCGECHLKSNEVCDICGAFSMEKCPYCGSEKTDMGFGLAGGGYGAYLFCEDCGRIISKFQEPTEEPPKEESQQ